jgi:hypothetical protein
MENTSSPDQQGRVAGSHVRYGPTGHAQRIKTGGAQWSDEAEELFLDVLASSCNVTMAAEATGFHTQTAYRMRRLRPDFAARWKEALIQGYIRLEFALVQAACDSVANVEFDSERPIPKMTVDQAMGVLRAHKGEVMGDGKRGPGNRSPHRSLDEVKASITKKIAAIEAARKIDPVNPPVPFASSAAGMPIGQSLPPGVSTMLDTNG